MPVDLILNFSLLVALTVVSTFFGRRFPVTTVSGAVIQGCLFGAASVIGMMRPLVVEQGLIFDGRSIMLSLCALFFGPWAALSSVLPTALYRLSIGGAGVYMGVLVTLSSAAVGLVFHRRWRRRGQPPSLVELLVFGFLVHVAMLVMTAALPAAVRWSTLKNLAAPILLCYPLVTVLAGKILTDQAQLAQLVRDLRDTNQRLDITLRSIADGVLTTDLQGRVASLNPTAERLTGWPQAEASGRPVGEVFRIVHELTREPAASPVERVLQEKRVVGLANHTVLLGRDGVERPIADSAAPILDNAGVCCGVVLVFRDQSQERESRHALLESEARYRSVVETAPALVWRCDEHQQGDYFNHHWLKFRGRTLAQEAGGGWTQGVHPEDVADFRAAFQEAFADRRACKRVYRLQRHDGVYRWLQDEATPQFDQQGRFLGCIGFCLDVTEQKEALDRVQLLLQALEASAASIFLADAGGFIEWVNPAFAERTGVASTAAKGAHWEDFLQPPPAQAEGFTEQVWKKLLAGQTWRGELLGRRRPKAAFAAEAVLSPVKDEHGRVVKVVGVFEDITPRQQLEEQVRQVQKMDAIGRLASGVAHDFNNILSVITMSTTLLQDDQPLTVEQGECVRQIFHAAEHASNLTRQLLTFGRRQTFQPEEVELNELIKNFSKMLRRVIGENIRLDVHLATEALWLQGDRGLLEQILMNLAVNARDAMPHGGTLTIATTLVSLGETAPDLPPNAVAGRYARLSVRDNGTGIAPELLPHIFEPFFTTKEVGKGSGLGLAVVHGAVAQHGGWVQVESQPGLGTTFHVNVPFLTGATVAGGAAQPAAAASGGTESILIVEDEVTLRELAAKTLQKYGYRVLTAAHGDEALALFASHGAHIDLVLTDIIMPQGLNGDEVARKLRENKPGLRVVFMSGYPGDDLVSGLVLQEGVNFIQKPFTPKKLAQLIRSALDRPPA